MNEAYPAEEWVARSLEGVEGEFLITRWSDGVTTMAWRPDRHSAWYAPTVLEPM